MTDPTDQAERDRIAERTDRTLFVSAGAGSGKTTALVSRVTRLVLHDGIAMENVAAVTFTTKAAAELRDRLRAAFETQVAKAADETTRQRSQAALDSLDLAAIGTLHSFAQRILAAHPIEAQLPPSLEVLDEVGSSIALEERWSRIQQLLLDDDAIEEPLVLGLAAGITLKHLRQLVRLLGQDWDRIETHVLRHVPDPLHLPDLSPAFAGLTTLAELRGRCTNPADKLYAKLCDVEELIHALTTTTSLRELLEALPALQALKLGSTGVAAAWSGTPPKSVRDEVKQVLSDCLAIRDDIVGQCLRHLSVWAAQRVLDEATARRRSGQLEFHDLLVLARNLLATTPDARATLHQTYQRLLLDEFQDTDPVQIELAVRIAGGRDAGATSWRDVVVPPGRLFVVGDAKQSIYRFRRASIATYLDAQATIGEPATLSTNFRSVPSIVAWVNSVFDELITYEKDGQPQYEALVAHRQDEQEMAGPAVTVLGAETHPKLTADQLRSEEATDVAGVIRQALSQGWSVYDEVTKEWRPARPADIAVLIPSRTSMPQLEAALDAAGIPFRAEAMSLVYEAADVRDLLLCARAIADPSDELALVATLRSPLFGCGDDDLWTWRRGGGRFQITAKTPEDLGDSAVAGALSALSALQRSARWLTASEVLARIVVDRRMLELAAYLPRSRDSWRRLRFVVDQARAWTDVSHGGLRAYLRWAAHQAQEKSRVSEAILPEQDVDAVRVMTVHAAKGLEFPIVILSGMSTRPRRESGARLLWRDGEGQGNYTVQVNKDLRDPAFEGVAAIDEQMGDLERTRLLYVAATRARDHLVVSLHRCESSGEQSTAAELIHDAGSEDDDVPALKGVHHFVRDLAAAGPVPTHDPVAPPPELTTWLAGINNARAQSRTLGALTASGLEGTEPEVVLGSADDAGRQKGPRDLDLPPWSKGRYGSAVGRAVHGALQVVDLATGAGLEDAVRAQVLAEGVSDLEEVVGSLVRAALASELVQRAATREHWRETYAGAPNADGELVEGVIDLLYREDDGSLVVIDYKTDVVSAETLDAKVTYYRPQLTAYRDMLTTATSLRVAAKLLFLHPAGSFVADV